MNEAIISCAFEEQRQKTQKDMKYIYDEISKMMKNKPVEWVTKEITIAEASKLNTYCRDLEQTLRKTVCEKMADAGVPDNEVNIIWARAKRKTGTAQIELCKEQKQSIPHQDVQKPNDENPPERQKSMKCSGPTVIASGAAVEIIGWVFVPGMGKFAAAVKGIGLVLMAAGVYMTYEESKEKPRIKISEEVRQQESDETHKIIDSICEDQCKLNTTIICKWLESICEAVLQECRTQGGQ